jgi:pimeloyl-ACP methyl ester carboxylesterase
MRWIPIALACTVLVGISRYAAAQPTATPPVVVLPGILGSKLCARETGEVIWGNRWSLAKVSELALPVKYDPRTLPHVACGVIEAVNVLGPFQIHQYDDLFATLKGMGYEVDRNLFVFPYDWRLSNRDSARQFAEFMQQKVPTGKVDIVAHSMGGIVAKLWMAEHKGANRVATLVTMGTPYMGSADTFKTLDQGMGFWQNLMARGITNIRETALTWPSMYELMPSYGRCCGFRSNTSPQLDYFDPFASGHWNKFGWVPTSFKSSERQEWLKQTLSTAKAITRVEVPMGPNVVPIVNSLIPTAWRVEFDASDGRVLEYIDQPGDGTVYQNSAANNQLPNARPALTRHSKIFADDASRQVLRWVLTRGPEPTKGVLPIIQANLRTASGALVPISAASAEIVPPVLDPGGSGIFIVELRGSKELVSADLSNVSAFREGLPNPLVRTSVDVLKTAVDSAVVRLTYSLTAPQEPGAFSVTVNLPAVAELPDVGVVVPK